MDVVAGGLGFVEGPVWHDDALWFTSMDDATVCRIPGPSGPLSGESASGAEAVYRTGGEPNGLTAGPGGALYVANNGGLTHGWRDDPAGIQRLAGGRVELVCAATGDGPLRAPNDLCFGPDGRLYFTDPANNPAKMPFEYPGLVCRLDLDRDRAEVLHAGLLYPNGIAFHPDGQRLLVGETMQSRVLAFPWSPAGLGEPEVYCTLEGAFPDGMCFDAEGTLYVAGTLSGEVQAFAPDGKLVERYSAGPGAFLTNCCFGDPDFSTLYVTDAATMLDPPHDERHRQRVVTFTIGVPGLPLFTDD